MIRKLRFAIVGAALLPSMLRAQSIRGVVVDAGDRPVPGVVLQLLDSTAAITARSLSNERGEFRLSTTRAGMYRVRTLRIGFRPVTSEAIALVAGAVVTQHLVFTGVPFAMDTVRVAGRSVCRLRTDSAAATFAVWEQVRAALNATQLTGSERAVSATTITYERRLDRFGRRVLKQSSEINSGFVVQPWRSLSADSLSRAGYVFSESTDGGATFYAPGLDVLVSNNFIEDHCFRLASAKDTTRLNIVFEPTPQRREVAEIKGTLSLDRKTSQLRTLEYRYVNVRTELDLESGGDMEFAPMKNGTWAISRWNIRMPVVARAIRTASMGGDQRHVEEVQVTGGELVLAFRGGDTLWSRPPLVLAGVALDSLSGSPVVGARITLGGTSLQGVTDARGRFSIANVLPGEYTVQARTASLDSVSAVHEMHLVFTDTAKPAELRVPSATQIVSAVCGVPRTDVKGVVIGKVTNRGDAFGPRRATVSAEWKLFSQVGEGANTTLKESTVGLETRASPQGEFRICGVPLGTLLTIRAEPDSGVHATAQPVFLRIPEEGRFARADLTLDPTSGPVAVFSGTVLSDSTKQPVVDVEVALPDLALAVRTNARGEFRLAGIPAGTHRVVARKLGFGALDAKVEFAANKTVERQIFLGRTVTLETVKVTARDLRLERFEDHRKMAFGQFLNRAELEKKEGQTLNAILAEMKGLTLKHGTANHGWVSTARPTKGDIFTPTALSDKWKQAPPACYADVYLDGALVFSARRGQTLFDVNDMMPESIEAIEYYSNHMQTPMEYTTTRDCGVLVIHSRR